MTDKELKDLVASLAVQNKELNQTLGKWNEKEADWREKMRKKEEAWAEKRRKEEEAWAEKMRKEEEARAEKRRKEEEARAEKMRKEEEAWAEKMRKEEEARAEKMRKEEEARAEKAEKMRKENEAWDKKWREDIEEIKRIQRNTDKQLGTMSDHDGEHTEQYFQNIFNDKLEFGGMKYDKMFANFECSDKKKGLRMEFDIVLVNCKSVAIIEVKNSVRSEFVWKLVKDRLPVFRQFFPEYNDHKVYLGIAGFSFGKKVLEQAEKYGVGVIRQVGDSAEAMTGKLKAY